MTFKHTKFEDSVTMRSLEKIAIQHGLVASEPLNKTASSEKEDFVPSQNLMQNVIKLCSGLRSLGFEKHANELESKFLDYKRAFNAYETSKETGDDLIDAAHPKGSHALVGVEGDAVVETILDEHLKLLKIVEKNPTGKLASFKDIVGAVKLVLAQDVTVVQSAYQDLKNTISNMIEMINNLGFVDRQNNGVLLDLLNLLKKYDTGGSEALTNTAASIIKIKLDNAYNTISPHRGMGMELPGGMTAPLSVSLSVWNQLEPLFNNAYNDVNILLYQTSGKVPYKAKPSDKPVPTAPEIFVDEATNGFKERVVSTTSKIKALSRAVERNDKPNLVRFKDQANKWLEGKLVQINKLVADFSEDLKIPNFKKEEVVKSYLQELSDITDKPGESLDDFKKTWG